MPLEAVVIDLLSGKKAVIMNKADARRYGITLHDRLKVTHYNKQCTAVVEITDSLVSEGKIGIYREVAKELDVREKGEIELAVAKTPQSVQYIRKKVEGKTLGKDEIGAIIKDVVNMNLSELEIAAFLLAQEFYGMSMDEIEAQTRAMLSSGTILEFPGTVVDKHSTGGVPGNKVSLLIVPIVASTGLLIPKTSSRAITSPSGTVDTMSVVAEVGFSATELKTIVTKTGGAIVWGGSLNLAPADDIFVRVEQPLRIDPRSQMIASIISKKAAVSAEHLVLDIPMGRGAKAGTVQEAQKLAADFIEIGRRIGINVRCGITYGGQPVGRAVGPALEAKEALAAMENPEAASKSLVEKSASLAGLLLECGGIASKGKGAEKAMDILKSGKALKKFLEIVEAQGGNPRSKSEEISVGSHIHRIYSVADGYVTSVDNETIVAIARAAGAPIEKGAGVLLHAKQGYKVEKGGLLMEIFAERSTKLAEAVSIAQTTDPMLVEGMLLSTVPEV